MFTCDSLCLCTLFCILQEAASYVDGQRGSLEENKEGIEIDPISFDSNSSGNEVLIPCGHSQSRVVLIKNTSASYVSIKDTPSFSINPQVCLRPRQNFSHLQCIHLEGSCRQCTVSVTDSVLNRADFRSRLSALLLLNQTVIRNFGLASLDRQLVRFLCVRPPM